MMPFLQLVLLPNKLHFSKARPLIVRYNIYCEFLIKSGGLFLFLSDAAFDHHVHEILHISFPVDFLALFHP